MISTIPKTMRGVVYRGINDLRLETLPVPRIGSGELLVKVAVCGVCPTDIKKIQYGTVPPPRVFGHETAGTIVKMSARVRGFRVGDRVALHHHIPCRKCHACRHGSFAQCAIYKKTGITAGFEPAGGGYAEYIRVMPFVLPGVVKIPARNSFLEGAMLEPVNTVLKAVRRLNLLRGDSVLVIGQGPIGLIFTRLLVLEGMRVAATDFENRKLLLALKLGAKLTFQPSTQPEGLADSSRCVESARPPESSPQGPPHPEGVPDSPTLDIKTLHFTQNRGFDAVIVAVPSDAAVDQALALVRPAGKVLLFAHTRRGHASALDFSAICLNEKDLLGSYSADVTLQAEVARLVFSRKLDVRPLISHIFSLQNISKAVSLAAHPTAESLKVVVSVSGAERETTVARAGAVKIK